MTTYISEVFSSPILIANLATGLLLTILFLQSGLDKVFDWGGNISWLKGHFSKTIFRNMVPAMTATITLVELSAGFFALVGVAYLLLNGETGMSSLLGLSLAALALIMLFFGQRLAKDYAGASTLAIYFGVVILGLIVHG